MKTAIRLAIESCDPPTQAELARRTGFSRQLVSRWTRRGWVTGHRVPRVAEVTGVPIPAFLADALQKTKR